MEKKTRIAIYGDVNLNLIDGSSVWVQNIARLSAAASNTLVHVYSKAPVVRTGIVDALTRLPNVELIHPRQPTGTAPAEQHSLDTMVRALERENLVQPYDVVIIRGMIAAERFAASETLRRKLWLYLTDIPQTIAQAEPAIQHRLERLSANSRYMLCQTEALRNFLETHMRVPGRKLLLLPPLVNDEAFTQDERPVYPGKGPLRLLYAGKFAPLWALDEQLDVYSHLRTRGLPLEFHVIGDKFHSDPGNPAFASELKGRLLETDGVLWYGGIPQSEVFSIQKTCHVGMAFRRPEMNNSLELSTKLLEYGASGLAALTNPTVMHRQLLGEDYPLFANSTEEARERLTVAMQNPDMLTVAASRLRALAKSHTMEAFLPTWNQYIARMAWPPSLSLKPRKSKVLLAGHDLKFCKELIEYLESRADVELRIDHWASLREHDEVHSRGLLAWADTIICEWCAGNAVWYSNNVNTSKQRLFVRFHRFEINSEFPAKVDMSRTEKVIFVGQHILNDAVERFRWPRERLIVVPNFVDTLVYDRSKLPNARFNLGLIGYVPMLKRLDRAVDIMEHLLEKDDRYFLFVKGKHPWDYPWIWRSEKERTYYEEVFARIRTGRLKDHIVFDGFGDDIPAWLRKIGFVLSVSDLESFHMAAAEGMASGADAVLWEREGVEAIFPGKPVFRSASQAADFILERQRHCEDNKQVVAERYSYETVSSILDDLLE